MSKKSQAPKPKRASRPTKQIDPHKAISLFGKAHLKEISVKEALIGLGYAESQADKGWHVVNNTAHLSALSEVAKAQSIEKLKPKRTKPEEFKNLALYRLEQNLENKEDCSVKSVRALGDLREHDWFTPEAATGVIVIEAPKTPLPTLSAEFVGTPQYEFNGRDYVPISSLTPSRSLPDGEN